MYCKICGFNNPNEANYCLQDGIALQQAKEKYSYINSNSKFCSCCGTENKGHLIYCGSCGNHLRRFEEQGSELEMALPSTEVVKKTITRSSMPALPKGFNLSYFKQALPGAVVSIALILLLSTVVSIALSEMLQEAMGDLLGYRLGFDSFFEDALALRITDIILLFHMIGFKVNMTALDGYQTISGTMGIGFGAYLFYILPFIALFIGGYVSGKKHPNATMNDRFFLALSNAIIYTGFLMLVSLLATKTQTISLYYDESIRISHSYSIGNALLKGMVLGYIFSLLGLLMALGAPKITGHLQHSLSYGMALHQGVSTVFRGVALTTAYWFFFALNKIGSEIFQEFPMVAASISQLSGYLWGIANLGTLFADVTIPGDSFAFSVSLLSTGKELYHPFFDYDQFNLLIYAAFFTAILLFVWAGKKIKESSTTNLVANLIVFSGVYAFLSTFFITAANIKLVGSGNLFSYEYAGFFNAQFGFLPVKLFISSFLMALVVSYGASFLFKEKIISVVEK